MTPRHPLIELARTHEVRRKSLFPGVAARLTGEELASLWTAEVQAAPRRHAMGRRGGRYLGERAGLVSVRSGSRRAERLAVALFNRSVAGEPLELPDGGRLDLIDYRVPLRASSFDTGVGEIDLLGLDDEARLVVVALEFSPPRGRSRSRLDSPLQRLLQGLAHSAMLWANQGAVGSELDALGIGPLSEEPPMLIVLGNERYWVRQCFGSAGRPEAWMAELDRLARDTEREVGVAVRFLALEDAADLPYRDEDARPILLDPPKLRRAW
jgi:hypothetical protein